MKYRIIKEADGNGKTEFEVHFYERVRFLLLFKKWKWVQASEMKHRMDFSYRTFVYFESMEDAQKYVNKFAKKRTLESMGEVNDDRAYTC